MGEVGDASHLNASNIQYCLFMRHRKSRTGNKTCTVECGLGCREAQEKGLKSDTGPPPKKNTNTTPPPPPQPNKKYMLFLGSIAVSLAMIIFVGHTVLPCKCFSPSSCNSMLGTPCLTGNLRPDSGHTSSPSTRCTLGTTTKTKSIGTAGGTALVIRYELGLHSSAYNLFSEAESEALACRKLRNA